MHTIYCSYILLFIATLFTDNTDIVHNIHTGHRCDCLRASPTNVLYRYSMELSDFTCGTYQGINWTTYLLIASHPPTDCPLVHVCYVLGCHNPNSHFVWRWLLVNNGGRQLGFNEFAMPLALQNQGHTPISPTSLS